jgi:hypothetical protein
VEYTAELAVVCNYTCGFVAQPPGTRGYSHANRLVAPVVPLSQLVSAGVSKNDARRILSNGQINGVLRLPPPPGWEPAQGWKDDEFSGQLAACLFKVSSVDQQVLDARALVARLSVAGQRRLINAMIQVVSPYLFDPDDEDLQDPDMSNSWAPR